jgi:hypothetical protein
VGKGFVAVVVALVSALTFSAIGEEPLPAVIAKAALPQVTTEVEPVHETATPLTLAEAAQHNDFAAFDALFTTHPNPAFADLHALWVYSQTERFGAFYGEELHAKFARRYAGYAAFIEEYRIVDARGAAYWPTAETRTFLVEHTGEAISDQRSAIRRAAAAPKRHVAHVAATPLPVIAEPPAAPLIADRGSLIAQPAQTQPAPVAQRVQTADNSATGRGILLMILGLVGVGVLTLMLRTPPPEEEHAEPQGVITTLRLTSLPQDEEEPRKTGSHG